MFYSHTFLGRKGPLGTVWIAAHLQHKLRKTHYMSTDIKSIAEQIMFPDVPIALRMSGHLLLGLVRIYSKKVDYLFQDCNVSLITIKKAFVTGEDVTLPPNANHAQPSAVTFPTIYELDAVSIDYDWPSLDGGRDNNTVSYELITLSEEQAPPSLIETGSRFDDEVTQPEAYQDVTAPMEENTIPTLNGEHDSAGLGNPQGDNNLDNVDKPEKIRAAETNSKHQFEPLPELQLHQDTPLGSSSGVHMDDPEVQIPDLGVDNSTFITSPERSPAAGQLFSNFTGTPQPLSHTQFELVDNSPNLEILPSPPQPQPQPQPQPLPRRRNLRRKLIDNTLVLSNKTLKRNLQDCNDIVRKKRKLPCAALDTWRLNKKKKMEQSFKEPSVTGMCSDLRADHDEGFIRSHPSLNLPEEVPCDVPSTSEQSPEIRPDKAHENQTHLIPETIGSDVPSTSEQSLEIRRKLSHENRTDLLPEIFSSDVSSTSQQTPEMFHDDANQICSMLEVTLSPVPESPQTDILTSPGTQNMPTFETENYTVGLHTDTRTVGLEMETPSDFPHSPTSFDVDLTFLEADSSTPAGSPSVQGNETMSARTRRVAQIYLENCSPTSSSSAESSSTGAISLNAVLKGRSRKLCARMIFETLTLQDRGLIEVQQYEPYGDIIVRVTSRMSQDQF